MYRYRSKLASGLTIAVGVLSLIFFYAWWFHDARLLSPWLLMAFIFALGFGLFQLLGTWLLYLAAERRPVWRVVRPVPPELTVDIFVTTLHEDIAIVERCLQAAMVVRGRQSTWLLDDAGRPELQELAARLGAGYLTRSGNRDNKAGNVNAALTRTSGDIIAIFDVDHVPHSSFLEHSLGHFENEQIGFVQVMLTFSNGGESWVAGAAADSSLDFFNPASLGADGLGVATLIGSNALIRRTALQAIGGYRPGLAEDLATSVALHAHGWRSAYVNRPLAPGLAPPDLTAWFNQQFKWARGVFELLLTVYIRDFRRLLPAERLVYGVRMTYYWIGLVMAIHLLLTIGMLLNPSPQVLADFQAYLLYLAPLALMTGLIRTVVLRHHAHPALRTLLGRRALLQSRPLLLVLGTWPVYTMAWFMAVLRIPMGYRPTGKRRAGNGAHPLWLWPQLVALLALLVGIVVLALNHGLLAFPVVTAFSALMVLIQAWMLAYAALERGSAVKTEQEFKSTESPGLEQAPPGGARSSRHWAG